MHVFKLLSKKISQRTGEEQGKVLQRYLQHLSVGIRTAQAHGALRRFAGAYDL